MISPGFLDELDRFETAQKRHVSSLFAGEQESREIGEGLTFADYRPYAPGDDTRRIDWKLYGRTDELHVRQFERERNLTVHALVDASGSMDFGAGDHHKYEFAAKLGLGFAYLTALANDDFRFAVLGDGVERLDAGRSTRAEVLRLVDDCNAIAPDGDVAFERALSEYEATIGSRSLVFVASDFLGDPADVEGGLAALASNRVILAHVVAPEERDLPAHGETVFEDLETGGRLRSYAGSRLRRLYRERLDAHLLSVADSARGLGARHEVVDTGTDFFDAFATLWVE